MLAYNVSSICIMNNIKSACGGNSIPVRGIEAEISFCQFIFINPLFIQVKSRNYKKKIQHNSSIRIF